MNRPANPTPRQPRAFLRWTLFIAGFVAIALAVIGIFLPVLPTVPFLLLAVACFDRSSDRFHTWLVEHSHLGPMIRPYLQGRGISRASKFKAIGLIWISLAVSVLFLIEIGWVRGGLLAIGAAVSIYLLRLPELPADNQDEES